MAEVADVEAVFRARESGPYPNPYLTLDQLIELSNICLRERCYIAIAEAVEVTAEADTVSIGFSLLDEPTGGWAKDPAERAIQSNQEILGLAEEVRAQSSTIMFEVWIGGPED